MTKKTISLNHLGDFNEVVLFKLIFGYNWTKVRYRRVKMPEISSFYGIQVYINFREHNPPHFHAKYAEYKIIVYLDGWVVEGKFPKRALQMLLEWAEMHKDELLLDWNLAMDKKLPKTIEPLK